MYGLIPAPVKLEPRAGDCDLSGGAYVKAAPELTTAARLASAWLEAALGFSFKPAPEGRPAGRLHFALDAGISEKEAYRLEIGPDGVVISASTVEGAIRAASTLRQLALSAGPRLPALRIEDKPRFEWRGAMLDTARNFSRVEFLLKFIDLMALHKLNRFHWHLTDDQAWRLDIPALPEIARLGSRRLDHRMKSPRWNEGFYTREDVRRVVNFAGDRGIVVVPEIETPGHAIALLASHPELSCRGVAEGGLPFLPEDRYGVFEDVLCAGNEGAFGLLAAVFDEVSLLFPGPWVHAGGDEVPKARWKACPRCRSMMKAQGFRDEGGAWQPERLQGWFMDRVADLIVSRGKRMIGWDEILKGEPRRDAMIMSWRGFEGGIAAARAGYEVVMSPQTRACYLDHKHLDLPEEPGQLGTCTVRDSWEFDPIPPGLSAEEEARILGGQANIWTELMYFGRQIEYMAFPRLCALSEALWSPKDGRRFADFATRLEVHGRRLDTLDVNRYGGRLE
jgi:hexosaminidase